MYSRIPGILILKSASGLIEFDSLLYSVDDLKPDDWVNCIAVDKRRWLIFVAYDSNIATYNFHTGKRIETHLGIHTESISSLLLWEEQGYWITGSKDSKIKIWNSQNFVLYELKGHYNTITSLYLSGLGRDSKATFLLSASLDSTIRMWNMEDGKCLYKINTANPIKGMIWMRDNIFSTYSDEKISIWSLNQFFSVFSLNAYYHSN
jgi:WD40 repeat protein